MYNFVRGECVWSPLAGYGVVTEGSETGYVVNFPSLSRCYAFQKGGAFFEGGPPCLFKAEQKKTVYIFDDYVVKYSSYENGDVLLLDNGDIVVCIGKSDESRNTIVVGDRLPASIDDAFNDFPVNKSEIVKVIGNVLE